MTTAHVDVASQQLRTVGAHLLRPAELNQLLGIDRDRWRRFGAHWDELAPDPYAAELGTQRLRRYGHFRFDPTNGTATAVPDNVFVQPENSNPLYIGRERRFEPLTDTFAEDPLLQDILRLLGRFATVLDDVAQWSAKVTPFRVLASADDAGQPTPEGLHRDGVTLVTSLLIARDNAVGGESSVYDLNDRCLLKTTLSEPGTLLIGDDRCTLHGVSPIRPVDATRPARRDVLVITFAPSAPRGRQPHR
jgi:hypothetical protein